LPPEYIAGIPKQEVSTPRHNNAFLMEKENRRAFARVFIDAVPAGALAEINGRRMLRNNTGLFFSLAAPGVHNVRIMRNGREIWRKDIVAAPGDSIEITCPLD
jgi:hypothetical protein